MSISSSGLTPQRYPVSATASPAPSSVPTATTASGLPPVSSNYLNWTKKQANERIAYWDTKIGIGDGPLDKSEILKRLELLKSAPADKNSEKVLARWQGLLANFDTLAGKNDKISVGNLDGLLTPNYLNWTKQQATNRLAYWDTKIGTGDGRLDKNEILKRLELLKSAPPDKNSEKVLARWQGLLANFDKLASKDGKISVGDLGQSSQGFQKAKL